MGSSGHPLESSRIGDDDDVILYGTTQRHPLGAHYADNRQGQASHTDCFTYRGSTVKTLLHSRLADHGYKRCILDVLFCKHLSALDRPLTDLQVVGRLAIYSCEPVLVTVNRLPVGSNLA